MKWLVNTVKMCLLLTFLRLESLVETSLFQALGLWGKSEKAGERGKDERGRRRAKEREPVRISLTALCRYSRSCYTL